MEDSEINCDTAVETISKVTGYIEHCPNITETDLISTSAQPTLFSTKTLLELSKTEWINTSKIQKPEVQPYVRGCAWSPDGTCCLAVVSGAGAHVTELPRELYAAAPSRRRPVDQLPSVLHVPEAGLVYDFCWYPLMDSARPETCCWLTTRRHGPVQMWDAFDGGLRCSYRGYDAVDEVEAALSVAFSPSGDDIYAGYRKSLRTFHTGRPGRDCSEYPLKTPASCLASAGKLLAVGSWNASLSLLSVGYAGALRSVGKMHGHTGGVTHVKFTPDGTRLVSGARKDHRLLVFDLRRYGRPLAVLERRVTTNQRVYLDVSPCGRYLVSGGGDGALRVWEDRGAGWGEGGGDPTYVFPLHDDCLNSVSSHPHRPIIATGSGQYHSPDPIALLHDSTDEIIGQSAAGGGNTDQSVTGASDRFQLDCSPRDINQSGQSCDVFRDHNACSDVVETGEVKCENSLVFWWIGEVLDL